MAQPVVPGGRALFYFKLVALGWFLLNTLVWQLMPRLYVLFGLRDPIMVLNINTALWTLFSFGELVVLVPFVQGRAETEAAPVAQATLALAGLAALLNVAGLLRDLGGALRYENESPFGAALSAAQLAATCGSDACLWLALARGGRTSSTSGFFAVLCARFALALTPSLLTHDAYRKLIVNAGWEPALGWIHFGLRLAVSLMVLALLRQIVTQGDTVAAAEPAAPSSNRDLVVGGVLLGVGLTVTLATYSHAALSGGGYFVSTGVIAWGLLHLIRGLVRLGNDESA